MDLRAFFKKLRETEELLPDEHAVVVSLATPEGGKAGVKTEVPRGVAAKLLVDGRARLAAEDEAVSFREQMREAKDRFERDEAARRMQVVVVPQSELRPKERG